MGSALKARDRRDFLKAAGAGIAVLSATAGAAHAQTQAVAPAAGARASRLSGADNFYQSAQVDIAKLRFPTQYGLQVSGNLIRSRRRATDAKLPAIIVGHPMGAVKEQSSMLYAQKLAEQGFATLAIDLPYWGESEGGTRNLVAPELYTEAFSAAVDFLGNRTGIAREHIGVLGICGSGGFALSAAKIDPRLKAIATVSMYDMGAVTRGAGTVAKSDAASGLARQGGRPTLGASRYRQA